MESDLVESICHEEFGKELQGYKQIVGGLNSKTYSADMGENSYIVQVTSSSEPHELENCLRSFEFLQKVVPVPETVTDRVQELDSEHYIVVEKLPGDAISKVGNSDITVRAGKELAKIHNSKSFGNSGWIEWYDGEPQVSGFEEGSLKSRIESLMRERKIFFEENDIDWLADITEVFLNKHVDKVPEKFTPVFVHHDFNPGNTLVKEGEITGILDLDYAHSSHAQRDLAKAANKFWLRKGNREDLYKGYRKIRNIDESFSKNENLYLLESLIDELAAMMEHEHITTEESQRYEDELLRLERELTKN